VLFQFEGVGEIQNRCAKALQAEKRRINVAM